MKRGIFFGKEIKMINRIIDRFNELITDNVDMDTGEACNNWVIDMQNDLIMQLGEIVKEESKNNICEWFHYDSCTIAPKCHDTYSPYWRIPENMDKLKFCPYCGKEIKLIED